MLNSLSQESAANRQPPDENSGGEIQTRETPPVKESAKGNRTDAAAGIPPRDTFH